MLPHPFAVAHQNPSRIVRIAIRHELCHEQIGLSGRCLKFLWACWFLVIPGMLGRFQFFCVFLFLFQNLPIYQPILQACSISSIVVCCWKLGHSKLKTQTCWTHSLILSWSKCSAVEHTHNSNYIIKEAKDVATPHSPAY